MHRTTKFQIAAKTDREIVKTTFFTINGQQIGKRLGRMAVSAIAGIDNRNRCILCGDQSGKALVVMEAADGRELKELGVFQRRNPERGVQIVRAEIAQLPDAREGCNLHFCIPDILKKTKL